MAIHLELVGLACERDERVLFSGLSQRLDAGTVVQIEGPNGSGKTTLLRVLTTLSGDYQGELLWCGEPLAKAKHNYLSNLLYIGHLAGVKKHLSPMENLAWYAGMFGGTTRAQLQEALEVVGLYGYEDVPCFQLSAGQHRRVALARLVFSESPVWILDEPFTAIDKRGVAALEQRIVAHTEKGGLVILTTHQDPTHAQLRKINLLDYRPGAQHA